MRLCIHVLLFLGLLITCFSSCEIINPPEKIPSYISVDTVFVQTTSVEQGTTRHGLSDCWVYVNNKCIGVFEVPFKIPVLEAGKQNIQIEPGIKNSGSNSNRCIYPLMSGWYIDTVLTEAKVLHLRPVFKYRPATFELVEDFEDLGISFETSPQSDTNIMIVSGATAYEGSSMYVALDDQRPSFECKSIDLYNIPTTSSAAFLEINFKTNNNFEFGFFALEGSGGSFAEIKHSVFTFSPTSEWKKVYIDLKYNTSNSNSNTFRLYFRCSRINQKYTNPQTDIYIDNIKLIYI